MEVRSRHLERLKGDLENGRVDPDIADILVSLNTCSRIVTTSSCSGRIALIAAPEPGDKRGGGVVASWHRRVEPGEISDALSKVSGMRFVWLSVQPPMLNVLVCGIELALAAVEAFQRVGFKYSGLRPTATGFYLVHVASTERVDIPIMFQGQAFTPVTPQLVEMLNTYLSLGKAKLERMRRAAASLLALCSADPQEGL
ncbi:MAG: hypothetical protein GXO15_01130 [Crenarchaeota archaeon]|nr:hypothetical protein [Thermoproteota archaeon]